MQKKSKLMIAGLASLAMAAGAHAGVKYIGTPGGTASSIVDLSVPSVDGVVYTEATFEAAFGGDYTPAGSAVNGVPTWQLTTADQYVLEDIVSITKGNLIIDAGVVVRGQPRSGPSDFDGGALLIAAGAKIIAAGEATNPIVFTTASTTGASTGGRASGASPTFWDQPGVLAPKSAEVAGLWGGVIVLGKAPTNADRDGGIAATATLNPFLVAGKSTIEQVIYGYGSGANKDTFSGTYSDGTTYVSLVAFVTNDDRSSIEGVPSTSSIALSGVDRFGGFDADDNSGIIKYASIRHGGSNLAANSEVNGLTLGGVGRGTTVSYVEIYGNTDDGLEIFGGTVNCDHILVVAQQDDGLDFDAGWTGTLQFAVVVGGAAGDKLLEWDGSYEAETVNGFSNANPSTITRTPVSNYSVYNVTLLGNTVSGNHGIHIRDQSAARLVNSLVVNAGSNLLEVDNRAAGNRSTTNNFATGLAEIVGVSFAKSGTTTASLWTNAGSDDATVDTAITATARANYFNIGANSNPGLATLPTTALSGGQNITLVPSSGSASAGALDAVLDDGTFSANATITFVTYRGAFEPDTNEKWTSNWTAAALAGVIVP
jgi:hypothetical protein